MKRFLSYSISLLLGGVLLYLALRGVSLTELGKAMTSARYIWLLPMVAVVVSAHALRAYRWKLLIEALPQKGASAPARIAFSNAFLSVLIGYLVNLATPRLGEVVRSANLARQENQRVSGVLGTVVIERLLDSLVLLLALVVTFGMYFDQLAFLEASLWRPLLGALGHISAVSYALVATLCLGAGVLAVRAARRSEHRLMRRLREAALSFRDGVYTLHRSPHRLTLLTTTVAMWGAYVLMAYLPLLMLDMSAQYDLGLVDAFAIMVFGSLGIAVPAPGGTGSYHYVIKLALMHVFVVEAGDAVVYAVLSHGVQLVLYTVLGAAALVIQGVSWQVLRTDVVESPRKAL